MVVKAIFEPLKCLQIWCFEASKLVSTKTLLLKHYCSRQFDSFLCFLLRKFWRFQACDSWNPACTYPEQEHCQSKSGLLTRCPLSIPLVLEAAKLTHARLQSKGLVGACLATGHRIFATGVDTVLKCDLRSCDCLRTYSHGLKGPQEPILRY